jgi:YegS/Rv2252/BmrU family lipid kinase
MIDPSTIVLFVINGKSGNKSLLDFEQTITKHSLKHLYKAVIFHLNDVENLEVAIQYQIILHQPAIVVAAGGDGTVNLVASILKNTDTILAILPLGSANGMAKDLQLPEGILPNLDLLVNGKKVKMDLLMVNDKVSVHLADVGLNARIVKRFQLDNKRGLLIYGKHLFNEILFLKRYRFKIYYDGSFKKIKAVSLTFANATSYGTGASINPDGILNDGFFEICIVKPFPLHQLFKITWQMFRKRLAYSAYFEVIKCKTATVKCNRFTTLQNDGEIMGKVMEIELKSLPLSLWIIVENSSNHPSFIN